MRIADNFEPFERVAIDAPAPQAYPAAYRGRLAIGALHDGDVLPARLLDNPRVREAVDSGALGRAFAVERDWGASLIAKHVATALGLDYHYRVNVARMVLDFNRFPGETRPHAGPMARRALSPPLSDLLTHEDKRYLLEEHYDAISAGMDACILGSLIVLTIHTYDAHNKTLTRRPELSLLTRSDSYQRLSRLPSGLFDPLFPDVLAESCAKPIVRDRIALTLEKAGFALEHNYPYCLPDGSLELRCQPWFYFQHVRDRFEADLPATAKDPAFAMVWAMLLNTNHRRGDGDALARYLHRFQEAPPGQEAAFSAARRAYERLSVYLADHPELPNTYRRSPDRISTITLEVRKDLVWDFDGDRPVAPREDNAKAIAGQIAQAIATYLATDRDVPAPPAGSLLG